MRKNYYFLLPMVIVLLACGGLQTKADKLFQVSDESLSAAAAMKATQLELVEARITEMAQTPLTSEKAIPLEIRIKRIVKFTNAANEQVKNLRGQLNKERNSNPERTSVSRDWAQQAGKLYIQFTQFRDSVFNIYWPLRTEFSRDFSLFGTGMDSLIQSDEDLSELLRSASYPAAFSFLSNARFNVLAAGLKCAAFCLESIAVHHDCDSGPNLIIAQNPQVVLPGTFVTMGFGVGIFPYGNRYQMEVSVENGPWRLLQNGIESIQVKAEEKPGHYKVPFAIRYLDQDGKRQELKKWIGYTVMDTLCAKKGVE